MKQELTLQERYSHTALKIYDKCVNPPMDAGIVYVKPSFNLAKANEIIAAKVTEETSELNARVQLLAKALRDISDKAGRMGHDTYVNYAEAALAEAGITEES